MRRDFNASTKIKLRGWFKIYCNFCCNNRAKQYLELIKRSKSRINKEMDLQKFLYRQRVAMSSLIGLLSRRQALFVDQFSQMVLRESSDAGDTSEDDELEEFRDEDMTYAKSMMASKDVIDQRLINMYKMQKSHQRVEGSCVTVLEAVKDLYD